MSVPVVWDIEFLASTAVNDDRDPSYNRIAYFAGLVCGLYIARAFSVERVTDAKPEFWTLLAGTERPVPYATEFSKRLSASTTPNLRLGIAWVPEVGLRHGQPGNYYAQGIRDAIKVGIKQVPVYFRYLEEDDWHWRSPTLKWINNRIAWAKRCLEFEKKRMSVFDL